MTIPIDISQKIDIAEKQLERLLEWISRLDTKFNIILGVELVMLGVLATSAPIYIHWNWFIWLFLAITIFFFGSSLYALYKANNPHLDGPNESLVFFSSIANLSKELYITRFYRQTQNVYLEDLLAQCHINSIIIANKFRFLKVAYQNLLAGTFFWVILIAIFKAAPVKP